jgi:hypothetical protein
MSWLKKVGHMKDICQSSGGTMLDRIRRKLRVDLTPWNDYLGNGLYCNVRRDFIDCDKGVRLRLKKDD